MTDKERNAVYAVAGGRSEQSGLELPSNWQVDHKIPRAAGGKDDVANYQALTAEENNAKSCGHVVLREWQQRFFDEYRASSSHDFLLVALPGSGKTLAALAVVKQWLSVDVERRRLMVVVPTDNLREQWKDCASKYFAIEISTTDFAANHDKFKAGRYQGASTTYQGVASNSLVFRGLMAKYEWMVIFDEIHHAGEYSTWGSTIKIAFENTARRLCMSGTPFRSDKTPIPFLSYDQNLFCRPDFSYDYPEAVRDQCIRVVSFDHYEGAVSIFDSKSGQECVRELNSEQSDESASKALGLILKTDTWQEGMLLKADEKLNQLRINKPDAGGLALAMDIPHASRLHAILERITGEPVGLVTSCEAKTTVSIDEFSRSKRKWIVAVRQVSEGTDIPRLMVLAYLTNYCTELFFKQAVGRIVRNQGQDFDSQSFCFMPSHPKLIEFAERIKEAQFQQIEKPDESQQTRDGSEIVKSPDQVLGSWMPDWAGTIIEGESLTPERSSEIDAYSKASGATPAAVLIILKMVSANQAKDAPQVGNFPITLAGRSKPKEDVEQEYKRKVSKLVGLVSYKTGREHAFIRSEANRFAFNKCREKNTVKYYQACLEYLGRL